MGRSAGTLILFSFGVHGLKSMVTTWVEPLALEVRAGTRVRVGALVPGQSEPA